MLVSWERVSTFTNNIKSNMIRGHSSTHFIAAAATAAAEAILPTNTQQCAHNSQIIHRTRIQRTGLTHGLLVEADTRKNHAQFFALFFHTRTTTTVEKESKTTNNSTKNGKRNICTHKDIHSQRMEYQNKE